MSSILDREHTVAAPGFNRWLVPPAALSVHLAIGQVYAFSVFNLPLTRLLGISRSLPEDWKLTTLGWVFSLAGPGLPQDSGSVRDPVFSPTAPAGCGRP
jgi:hypothetical protein